jgi:cell division protein FtsB
LEAATSVKTIYNNMSSAYATIVNSKGDSSIFSGTTLKYFFWINGAKKDCAYNSTVASALAKIETEVTARKVKTAVQLSTQVNASTIPREKDARQKLLASTKNASLESTQLTVSGVNSKFFEAGKLNLSTSVKVAELRTVFEQIKKANSSEVAEEKAKVFDEINAEIESQVKELEKVFPDYKKALFDVSNASISVEAVKKRYGEIDERVVALDKNVTQLKKELLSSEEALSQGNVVQANFTKISKNSEVISSQAANLKPKEAMLDPITILGVVVVILLLWERFGTLKN